MSKSKKVLPRIWPADLCPSGKMMKSLSSLHAVEECEGWAPPSGQKFGYTRQRYYKSWSSSKTMGPRGSKPQDRAQKPLPPNPGGRPPDYPLSLLDPTSLPSYAQKAQPEWVSPCHPSVERVLAEYGLQKKTSPLLSGNRSVEVKLIEPKTRCAAVEATRKPIEREAATALSQ